MRAMVYGPVYSHINTQKHNTQNSPRVSLCVPWSCALTGKHTEAQNLKVNKKKKKYSEEQLRMTTHVNIWPPHVYMPAYTCIDT